MLDIGIVEVILLQYVNNYDCMFSSGNDIIYLKKISTIFQKVDWKINKNFGVHEKASFRTTLNTFFSFKGE